MKGEAVATSEKLKIPLPTLSQINSDRITQLANQYWSPQTKDNHLPYDAAIVESIYLAEILGSSFSIRRIMMLEFSQYLENYLWPHYKAGKASHAHMMSIIVMINEKFRERVPAWQAFLKTPEQFPAFFEQVLRASVSDDRKSNNMREQTALLLFLNHCFGSMEVQLCRDQVKRLVSLSMWISLQEGRRNQEFKAVPKWRKYWRAIQKKDKPELLDKLNWERRYLQRLMIKFMRILETIPEDGDVDAYKIRYCERFLELMIDLEALLPTRRFFNTVMDDCHLVVRCQLAPLGRRIEGQLFTQIDVEIKVLALYKQFGDDASIVPILHKYVHSSVLKSWLIGLPAGYTALNASRPWLVYWILHALWILDDKPEPKILSDVVAFLSHCQHEKGGYGGGPGQMPHLGTTFAAVNALSIIGTDEAYDSIDRSSLQKFLWTVRNVDGSFALHRGGEVDIRGAYCAVSIAKVTNTYTDALFDKTAEWAVSCQTYEGGFAGCPGMEAHGGYAFCGIALLCLLEKTKLCDIDALLRWCVHRQMALEGGFQGRTNKLVDGCYSFWLGATFPMISAILAQDNKELIETVLFDQGALQEYILICCQGDDGGLIDKPGRPTDIYHTCYTLSGLSIAQHGTGAGDPQVVGQSANEINRIDPLHNMAPHIAYNALHYFVRHPPPVKE